MASTKRPHSNPGFAESTRTLSVSLLFVLPVLLAYELGLAILQPDTQNAAGVAVKLLMAAVGPVHLVFNGAVMLTMLVAIIRSQKHGGFRPAYVGLLVLESTGWALVMMVFAVAFTLVASEHIPRLAVGLFSTPPEGWSPAAYAITASIVHACGAGVYEELVFRLLLMSGLIAVFQWLLRSRDEPTRHRAAAVFLGLMSSAVLFALAHHLVEPIALQPMVFRTVCGAVLGLIFLLRGLAAAVYTHTIYDVFVFLHEADRAGYLSSP